MDFRVEGATKRFSWADQDVACGLGRNGTAKDGHEGDGATPIGRFALRRLLYRADRVRTPKTILPMQAIARDDGWCDDPSHPAYNRPVKLPFAASHEKIWRGDEVYDLVVVLGHNDAPIVAGAGSAIFLHLARPDYGDSAGCITLAKKDLLAVLIACQGDDWLLVK